MIRTAACCALFTLLACQPSGSSADGGADAGAPSAVEVCDRLAAARCELTARCYPAFDRETPPTCRLAEQARCLAEYDRLKRTLEAKTAALDVAQLSRCEERMRTSACVPSFPPDHPSGFAAPFADCGLTTGLLRGSVPSGSTCDDPVECAPGSVCIKPAGVCKGTCSALPQAGDFCGAGCGPLLWCDVKGNQDPTDDRCAALKGEAAPCDSSAECAPEMHCEGTCRRRSHAGERCVFDPLRLSTCDPGLACDVTPYLAKAEGTCVKPQPKRGACRYHWSCAQGFICYELDLTGFPGRAPLPGYCSEPPATGVFCAHTPYSLFVGDTCRAGTRCGEDSRCGVPPTRGGTCNAAEQDCEGAGLYCKPSGSGDVGTCTGPAPLGERCAFTLDDSRTIEIPCASGYCDLETTLSCREANRQVSQDCTRDGQCVSNRCAVQEDRARRCAPACL